VVPPPSAPGWEGGAAAFSWEDGWTKNDDRRRIMNFVVAGRGMMGRRGGGGFIVWKYENNVT
jgi:hypothetical protein